MIAYHMDPAATASRSGTPNAVRTAVTLYCSLKDASDKACAGSTSVKNSTDFDGPRASSQSAAKTSAPVASVTRERGAHTASAAQTKRPTCGSTSDISAQMAAAAHRC